MTPSEWIELAQQFGPFAFTILYVITVTPIARHYLKEATGLNNPPDVIATFRRYFNASWGFGMLLALISTAWFFYAHSEPSTYSGEIRELQQADTLVPIDDNGFTKKIRIGDISPITKVKFLFMRRGKFSAKDSFEILLIKDANSDNPLLHDLTLPYVDKPNPVFRIRFGQEFCPKHAGNQTYCLDLAKDEKFDQTENPLSSPWIGRSAYASTKKKDPKPAVGAEPGRLAIPQLREIGSPSLDKLIDTIQDERFLTTQKIRALQVLEKNFNVRDVANAPSKKEPVALTLLDLSRHSDPELSYFSRSVLNKVNKILGIDKVLVSSIKKLGQRSTFQAASLLRRLDRSIGNKVVEALSKTKEGEIILHIWEKMGRKNDRVLVPTGSAQGDRYYVQALWSSKQQNTHECLTRLYNQRLISDRTIEQEHALMKKRTNRVVYWYDKRWSINIADDIEQCGAKAKFLSFR